MRGGRPVLQGGRDHSSHRLSALGLSPRLTIAHKYYANLEAEIGKTEEALVRLVEQAIRHGNDPELFAGLVHACRYCGLFEQSVAACTNRLLRDRFRIPTLSLE